MNYLNLQWFKPCSHSVAGFSGSIWNKLKFIYDPTMQNWHLQREYIKRG